jgi:hypothetical protein
VEFPHGVSRAIFSRADAEFFLPAVETLVIGY